MADQYLLPCPQCSHVHRVGVAQAGQTLNCVCGASVDVPTLSGLRRLEPVTEAAATKTGGSWSPRHGLVFLGLAVTVASLAWWAFLTLNIDWHGEVQPKIAEQIVRDMESLTPADSILAWQFLKSPLHEHANRPTNEMQAVYGRWTSVALGGAVLGVVLILAAFVLVPTARQR